MRLALFIGITLLTTSCGTIAGWMYGIKKPKSVSAAEIKDLATSVNLLQEEFYMLDTLPYQNKLRELKVSNPDLGKDLMQPLQVRVYGENDSLVSWIVNCYVQGFPKLNWNYYGTFSVFPPAPYLKPDSVFYFLDELKWLSSLNHQPAMNRDFKKGEINILVYCCLFMKKQSRNLIKEIQNYRNRYSEKSIYIYYVITDNLFL
jgi:hypothetical protein